MKQHVPEERLALYVTDDLDGDIESIRAHLDDCADCRAVAAELEQTCSLLASAPDEPELEALAEVRGAVLSRLQRSRRGGRVWKWTLGAAAAAAVIALASFVEYRPEPVPVAPAAPQIAAIEMRPPAPIRPVRVHHRMHHRPAPGIQSVALIDQPHGAPVIKIATTDPNVVILLASDERTKTE